MNKPVAVALLLVAVFALVVGLAWSQSLTLWSEPR